MKTFSKTLYRLATFFGVFAAFLILALVFPKNSLAVCNFYQSMTTSSKDVTWSSTCTIAGGTVDGVDNAAGSEASTTNTATLTLNPGGSITINATGMMVAGVVSFSGGSVAIADTASMKIGNGMWVVDADADGYPDYTALYDATASGRRRLSLMKDYASSDCNDANGGTYGPSTWYQDFDVDTYGNPNVSQAACTQPGGYVSDNTDCYDSNANAKPGQTSCYTANRGDGSFDYDCSGGDNACNSCSTGYNTTASLPWRQCSGGFCWTDPYDTYFTGYTCTGSTSTCGAGGYSCTGSKASDCVYSPCSLSAYYNTGQTGCTVSCK